MVIATAAAVVTNATEFTVKFLQQALVISLISSAPADRPAGDLYTHMDSHIYT